jgi:hypothetical protein
MMEYTPQARLSNDDYERMVRLKNVDYWRALYSAVDPEFTSPLYPFLLQYYEVAQYLNDVEDYDDDVLRGQPNLLAIRNGSTQLRAVDDPRPWAVTPRVETMLADRILELAASAEELPESEREVAETKLADLLASARAAGLFRDSAAVNGGTEADAGPDVFAFSELPDVIGQVGRHAITDVDCAVCGGGDRHELFRSKASASTAAAPAVTSTSARESPRTSRRRSSSGAAATNVRTNTWRCSGSTPSTSATSCASALPDRGSSTSASGRGYLLQMAQVYGFEAYGIDSAASMIEPLRPLFGGRVAQAVVGRDPLPWTSFDVVVMTHVLEHLTDPGSVLREIASAMNDGGWVYVAVPDVESMDFKIFGKRWDVVNPLVHLQYFT